MIKKIGEGLEGPVSVIENFFSHIPGAEENLLTAELNVGLAKDPRFKVPLSALRQAAYVGDPSHVGDESSIMASAEVRALIKSKGLGAVDTRFVFDHSLRPGKYGDMSGKYRLIASKKRDYVADAIGDAAPGFLRDRRTRRGTSGISRRFSKHPCSIRRPSIW